MKNRSNESRLSGVAALLLFCVFAVCALAALLTGADSYRSIVQRDADSADKRICMQYLSTRIRQAQADGVFSAAFGDGDALCIGQTVDGAAYVTRIYVFDGWLMEQFCAADAEFSPQDGQRILPLGRLSVDLEQERLQLTVTHQDGTESRLTHALRTGRSLAS